MEEFLIWAYMIVGAITTGLSEANEPRRKLPIFVHWILGAFWSFVLPAVLVEMLYDRDKNNKV